MTNEVLRNLIEKELLSFRSYQKHFRSSEISVREGFTAETAFGCQDSILIKSPDSSNIDNDPQKSIGLTVMGITHGNELAGLSVVNQVLEAIVTGLLRVDFPVAFILGNANAALENKRYLESDLNRSFGRASWQTVEQKRAKEIEPVLEQSLFLLDLHQTREISAQPFFIFPYAANSLQFALSINPSIPIVTHWGDAFSKDGQCTDEYAIQKSGTAITIELGQNGFTPYGISTGFYAVVRAIAAVTSAIERKKPLVTGLDGEAKLYSWKEIYDFPQSGSAELQKGFYNFSTAEAGQLLGKINGKDIIVDEACWTLFPYYQKPDDTKKPTELCRLLRQVNISELPK